MSVNSEENIRIENEQLKKKISELEKQLKDSQAEDLAPKDIQERIKELKCLYTIASLSEEAGISQDDFLQKAVDAIPKAWKYPEITCTRIVFKNKIFKTESFKETQWKQSAGIHIHEIKKGSVDVFYLEEKPEIYEGPFLKEERSLIDTIAKNISQYLERKQAENAQQQSEENLRITLNSIGDAVIAADVKGRITQMNPVAEKLTGWRLEQALGQHIDLVFKNFNVQTGLRVENPVEKVLKTDEIVVLANHTKLISKEGKEYQIADSGSPIKNSKGKTVGVVLVFRDVTDEYEMVKKLTESEQKYRTIFENTGTATTILEKDGTISLANTKFAELSGYPIKEIENKKKWMEFVVPEDLERMQLQQELRRKNHQEALIKYEFRFIDKNKQIKEIYLTIDMIPGTDKSVASLLDITEKIKTEKALQQNEERFRKIVEGAPTPIFIQTEMKFSYLNPMACKLFGIKSPDELLGTPVMERFSPDNHDQIYERIHRLNVDRQSVSKLFEQKFIRVDGSEVWVETVGEPINYKGKDGALVFVRDISERKKADDELLRLKENLESEVEQKTKELQERVAELERFQEATIEREFRIKELRDEIERLRNKHEKNE